MGGVSRHVYDQIHAALDDARQNEGILPLVPAGAPVLRERAEPFDGQVDDDVLAELVQAMRETMRAAPGVGLAAPQVGIGVQLFVAEDPVPDHVSPEAQDARERSHLPFRAILNGEYEDIGDERVSFYEGCLSVPGYQAVVERSRQVRLTGADASGAAVDELMTGWPARIIAHETDHLHGILYLDRAEIRSLASDEAVAVLWNQATPDAAARALGFPLAQGTLAAPGQIL